MKLHLTPAGGLLLFSGYGSGYVAVNNVRYEKSVAVNPHGAAEWNVADFDALTTADFAFAAEQKAEIVILGTGARQRFPRPEITRPLAAAGIGVEVMDTRAACRTYNILAMEGRKVVAAIFVE